MSFASEIQSGKYMEKRHAKIGQLTMEIIFEQSARSQDRTQRKSLLDKSTCLPTKRQCELLNAVRSTAYTQPVELSY